MCKTQWLVASFHKKSDELFQIGPLWRGAGLITQTIF
jgi:hypothetical protein